MSNRKLCLDKVTHFPATDIGVVVACNTDIDSDYDDDDIKAKKEQDTIGTMSLWDSRTAQVRGHKHNPKKTGHDSLINGLCQM